MFTVSLRCVTRAVQKAATEESHEILQIAYRLGDLIGDHLVPGPLVNEEPEI